MAPFLLIFVGGIISTVSCRKYNETDLSKNITRLLNNLLLNYDKKFRPNHGGEPVRVGVHITVLAMGPISEKDMEFTFECYFRQFWYDTRLKFKRTGKLDSLQLASKMLKDIWRPDTYIRNGRQSYLHKLTQPNILLRVQTTGFVYVSQRLTIVARCPMFLRKFPMDTQACPIYLGSLGYSHRDIVYNWKLVQLRENLPMSQYKLLGVIQSEKNITDVRNPTDPLLSTLQAFFVIQRQQGYYVLQIYTPCSLIVVMSWVSFWINKEASPARVGLGIMTVLTMSTLGLGGRNELPKVSYSTALDMYIVACFGFVFAALVEYAVINFAHIVYVRKTVAQMQAFTAGLVGGGGDRRAPSVNAVDKPRDQELELSPTVSGCCRRRRGGLRQASVYSNFAAKARQRLKAENPDRIVDRIDTVAKFLFPFLYILFNALYWSAFLYWIPDEIDSIPSIKSQIEADAQ